MIRLLLLVALAVLTSPAQERPAPQQPIPFNHKQHSKLAIQCVDCHTIASPGFAAGMPREAACMGCHSTVKAESPSIRKLAEYYRDKKPVPWAPVYQVPDYVWFSHDLHYRQAHIQCDNCHGPVAEREVITKERPTSMTACIECHQKNKASTACSACHDIH